MAKLCNLLSVIEKYIQTLDKKDQKTGERKKIDEKDPGEKDLVRNPSNPFIPCYTKSNCPP